MPNKTTAKVALFLTPDGKLKQERLKVTWQRIVAREMKARGLVIELFREPSQG